MRSITPSELQRLKRQFVTVHRIAITFETELVMEKFVAYLEENGRSCCLGKHCFCSVDARLEGVLCGV